MFEPTGEAGFTLPIVQAARTKHRALRLELFATVALAVSLIIAATAVSIGMVRGEAPTATALQHQKLQL